MNYIGRLGTELIGDQDVAPPDPYPIEFFMTDALLAEKAEYLARLGAPEEWWPSCVVMDSTMQQDRDAGVPSHMVHELRVGYGNPARTAAELAHAASLGFALTIQPQEGLDLHLLAPALADLQILTIGGRHRAMGWSVLEGSSLRLLRARPSEPLPIMPKLDRLIADGANALPALASPSLTSAMLDLGREKWDYEGVIAGPISSLELNRTRGLESLPPLAHPELLETFRFFRAPIFDFAGFDLARNIDWVDLWQVREIRNVAALAGLRRLKSLDISGVNVMDDWPGLFSLTIGKVVLRLQRAIPKQGAEQLRDHSHNRWAIEDPKR